MARVIFCSTTEKISSRFVCQNFYDVFGLYYSYLQHVPTYKDWHWSMLKKISKLPATREKVFLKSKKLESSQKKVNFFIFYFHQTKIEFITQHCVGAIRQSSRKISWVFPRQLTGVLLQTCCYCINNTWEFSDADFCCASQWLFDFNCQNSIECPWYFWCRHLANFKLDSFFSFQLKSSFVSSFLLKSEPLNAWIINSSESHHLFTPTQSINWSLQLVDKFGHSISWMKLSLTLIVNELKVKWIIIEGKTIYIAV